MGLVIIVREEICTESRIVLGAVAPGPFRVAQAEAVLTGSRLNLETAEKVAVEAVVGAVPLNMNGYKIEIAKSLVKRALVHCNEM